MSILLGVSLATAQTSHRRPKAKRKAPAVVLPPMPVGPLPQVPLDQLPAAPPKVSYQNGQLAIYSQNSTLADILREVHRLTGANINSPGNTSERVVTHLGPGPARDVLAALLNGSSFNYVMTGSNADPGGVTDVLLTAKTGTGSSPSVAPQTSAEVYQPPTMPNRQMQFARPLNMPAGVQAGAQVDPSDENADDVAAEESEDNTDAAAEEEDQNQPDAAGDAGQQNIPANAGPKTPEQIMEMLRRGQQQTPQNGQPAQPGPPTPENDQSNPPD